MLRNGVCDSSCRVSSCGLDHPDCTCAPGCDWSDLGNCNSACLVPDCNYDAYPGHPACQSQLLRTAFLYNHIIQGSVSAQFIFNNYNAPGCDPAIWTLSYTTCQISCTTTSVLFSFGNCESTKSDATCQSYISYPTLCGVCANGYVNAFGLCLSKCAPGFQPHTLIPKLCVPIPEDSTDSLVHMIYVNVTTTGVEDGSLKHPYHSLAQALLNIQHKYTQISFFPGTHQLIPSPISAFMTQIGTASPRYISNPKIVNITISSIQCSNCTLPILQFITSSPCQFSFGKTLSISNINFDGNTPIIAGCTNFRCFYPAYSIYDSVSRTYKDDRNATINLSALPSKKIPTFPSISLANLFTLADNATVEIANVTFSNFRQKLYSLIYPTTGSLTFSNVNFTNIYVSGNLHVTSGIVSQSLGKGLNFTYEKGNVQLLNNGFEYLSNSVFIGLLGFLSADQVIIKNVLFSYNLLAKGSSVNGPLIAVNQFKKFVLQDCNFEHNFVSSNSLVKLGANLLRNVTYLADLQVVSAYEIEIVGCVLRNNSVLSKSLIEIGFQQSIQNVHFANITFVNDLAMGYSLISISSVNLAANYAKYGEVRAIKNSTVLRTFVFIPPKILEITNVTFMNCHMSAGFISISNLANVYISSVSIMNNTLGSVNFYTNTLQDFVLRSDIYMKVSLAYVAIQPCTNGISISNSYNVQIEQLSEDYIYCANGPVGVSLSNLTGSITISDSHFLNVFGNSNYGLILSLNSTVATLLNVVIGNSVNEQVNGVIAGYGATSVSIINSEISYCRCQYGTVLTAISMPQISISNSRFLFNEAITNGGVIAVQSLNGGSTQIVISNSEFRSNSATLGGVLYIEATAAIIDFRITSSTFIENQSGSGAVLYIPNISISNSSVIMTSTFTRNIGHEEGVFYFEYQSGVVSVSNSVFDSNTARSSAVIYGNYNSKMILQSILMHSNTGLFVISLPGAANYQSCEAQNITFHENVGVNFYLIHSQLSCLMCSFSDNSADSGSSISLNSNSTTVISFSSFSNNKARVKAGVALISSGSTLNISSSKFMNSTSGSDGGAFYLELGSQLYLSDSEITGSVCVSEGSAIFVNMNSLLTLINSVLTSNVGDGVIMLINSEATLLGVNITDNTSEMNTAGIMLIFAKINITNTRFDNQTSSIGSFVSVTSFSTAIFQNCSFSSGTAVISGGAISVFESEITLTSCLFSSERAMSGSSIVASANSIITLLSVSFLNQTVDQVNGGVVSTFDSVLNVSQSSFTIYNEGALSLSNTKLIIDQSDFMCKCYLDGSGNSGGALLCSDCSYILIRHSSFISLRADIGGAIYLIASKFSNVTIENSLFEANIAIDSGAIYADNINLQLSENNFTGNSAKLTSSDSNLLNRGGAVTALCSAGSSVCAYLFTDNRFQDNQATLKGGAVYWSGSKPEISVNSVFLGNKAKYGSDVASFAIKIASLNETSILDIASGQLSTRPLICALLDHYDNVVVIDNTTSAQLVTNWSETTIIGQNTANAIEGVLTFDSFIISAPPLQSVRMNVTTVLFGLQSFVEINLHMRACTIGESQVNNECLVCPPGKYSLNPKLDCQKCPEGAECFGNFTMVPKPGYWRSGNYSDVFFACPNPNACLGSTDFPSPTGVCDIGYEGNKCQQCSAGYSQFSKVYCMPCPNVYLNAVRIIGFILILLIFGILMVRSTINSAYKSKSVFSIHLKILTNYVQLSMLMSALHLSWPNMVLQLFEVHDASGSMIDQIISVDCILSSQSESTAYFIKLLLMSSSPLILTVVSVIVWIIVALVKHDKELLRNECVACIVILFFIVHPSIVRMMFSVFDCEEIDPGEYWVVGMNIRCWEGSHLRYTFALALPCLLIWGIGIPTLCLGYLRVKRRNLQNQQIKVKFGFLFNSYDSNKYYWEFIILYRKMLIILATLLFAYVSVVTQSLIILGILLSAMYIQYKQCPYTQSQLNELELRCIWVSIITIDCGFVYYSGVLNGPAEVFFLLIIIAANLYFLVLWIKLAFGLVLKQLFQRCKILRRWFPSITVTIMPKISHHFQRNTLAVRLYLRKIVEDSLNHQSFN